MRFLFRLAVLALAAVGVKALYDKLAPRQEQLRATADTFVDRTTSAARGVGARVNDAAQNLASTAQSNAAGVKDAAKQGADEVRAAAEQVRDQLADEARGDTTSSTTGSGAR